MSTECNNYYIPHEIYNKLVDELKIVYEKRYNNVK